MPPQSQLPWDFQCAVANQPRRSPATGRDRGSRRDRAPRRARLARAQGPLRRLHRHVLAGQRQVGRLRRGLRLLRPVALRRGGHADARDDDRRADPRARPRGRGRRSAPLLHGHPGPGPVQARLRERASRARSWWPSTRTSSAASRSATCRATAPTRSRTPASSACTTTWRPPRATTTRCPPRSATRAGSAPSTRCATPGSRPAWAASSTSASRASSGWRWPSSSAALEPTSVPINLLNPRPGTKFGDRDLMDPMEVVQWVAIFRLVIPDALFRLCGGRNENLGGGRAPAARGQGRPQRRDDGQLPHHARLRAGVGPRHVRGAGAERGAPGGQRLEPAARQPLRAGSRARPRGRRSTSWWTPRRRPTSGTRPPSFGTGPSAPCRRAPTARPTAARSRTSSRPRSCRRS